MTTASLGAGDEFAPLIDEARKGVGKITEVVNDIGNGINSVIDTLPATVAEWIHQRWNELMGLVDDVLAEMNRILAYVGDPPALRAAANSWAMAVGGPVSTQSTQSSLNVALVDDYWQGIAATAYKNTLPVQAAALTSVKTATDKISDILHDMATGIMVFWGAICAGLIGLLTAMIVAAVAAATVVGAPAAVGITAGEIGAFGALVAGAIIAGFAIGTKASTDAGALTNVIANDPAFPNGTWPASTKSFADASVHPDGSLEWKVIPP